MTLNRLAATAVLTTFALTAFSPLALADRDRRGDHRGSRRAHGARADIVVVGRASPRSRFDHRTFGPRFVRPRIVRVIPYRPYYYSYRPYSYRYHPGFSVAFSYGSGYPYGYAYPYSYAPYGYAPPPPGYLSVVPGRPYGGVRIVDAPRDAEVFADGYYMGIVDDFDGAFQHMNLEAGPHRIEIRAPGFEPIAFDVRVEPGRTITYRADLEPY